MILRMISRIWIFLWESYKFPSRLIFIFSNILVIQLFTIKKFDPHYFLVGSAMFFFTLLYYRISDEFKDEKTDKIFFPKRPLPSGRVEKIDLKILMALSGFVAFAIAMLNEQGRNIAFILIIYCVLMQFNFFIPRIMEKNRLIAFVAHAPYYVFMTAYLMALHLDAMEIDWLSFKNLALLMVIVLPGLHWEILRKTFIRERPGYQTYSSLLGYQGAILLALSFFFPLIMALRYLLNDNIFIPLIVSIILYSMHIWGLGLKEEEGLISLRSKSEILYLLIMLALVLQKYSLLF